MLVKLVAVGDKGRREKWERGSFPADFCFLCQLLHFLHIGLVIRVLL